MANGDAGTRIDGEALHIGNSEMAGIKLKPWIPAPRRLTTRTGALGVLERCRRDVCVGWLTALVAFGIPVSPAMPSLTDTLNSQNAIARLHVFVMDRDLCFDLVGCSEDHSVKQTATDE